MDKSRAVGIIGLGKMGSPIARNLLKAGFELGVYDISANAVEELAKAGARSYSSPEDLARQSHVTFTILPDSKVVREVVLGNSGILRGIKPGDVIVDMSTRDLETLFEIGTAIEGKQAEIVDAPISGTPNMAKAAELTVMASGKEGVVQANRELLGAIGKHVFYVGKLGNGTITKYANNLLVAVNKLAAFEATAFAKKAGIDLESFYNVITYSRGNSEQFTHHVKSILEQNLGPMKARSWQLKDLMLINELSSKMGCSLPMGAKALELVKSAVNEAGKETNETFWRYYERADSLVAIP